MICPFCNQEIEDGSTVCPVCGREVSSIDENESEKEEQVSEEPVEEISEEDVGEENISEISPEGEEIAEEVSEDSFEETVPKKKKSKAVPAILIILAVLVLLEGSVLTYGVFFNKGKLPSVTLPSVSSIVKSVKYKFKKDGYAYIKHIDIEEGYIEDGGTTDSGYTSDTFSFYTDPWIETWFSGGMNGIKEYDTQFDGQNITVKYYFDEDTLTKIKDLAGDFKEIDTKGKIKDVDDVITIVKTAKASKTDLTFVFRYDMNEQTIEWEVGLAE